MTNATKESVDGVKELLEGHETRCEKDMEEMWKQINALKNRLPLWATFLFTGLIGLIVHLLNMALK